MILIQLETVAQSVYYRGPLAILGLIVTVTGLGVLGTTVFLISSVVCSLQSGKK